MGGVCLSVDDGTPIVITYLDKGATISADKLYRYLLWRTLAGGTGATLGVIMVNPSKANAYLEDPTVRKVCGFAVRWGYSYVNIGNMFAWRATDIKELRPLGLDQAIGPANDSALADIMAGCDRLLFAWGPMAKLPEHMRKRWRHMSAMAKDHGKTPYCIGTAQDGHPRHPLMVSYATPCEPWKQPWRPNA